MATKSIVVNPDEWDPDIIDCLFADQDSYCSLISRGAAVSCKILEDRFSCPLNAGSIQVSLAEITAELFYIQNPKMNHGGFMRFWTIGDHGYAPEISVARVFTLEEVNGMHSIRYEEKIAWPKEYIDSKAVKNCVPLKSCDIAASYMVGMATRN
ncbi:hypothetical protein LCGC14_2083300 [marine sediment metagenome]|uniref:Uncharacterized protein n=1 Tax=marine sediment metagenome TaxID=412755 RepID=A0A0F9F265_9ZZZZ|nr:hypothetical protein [Phycisphaerales bacterium]